MASPILELLAKLGMDTDEYDQKLKDSKEDAKGFASSFVDVMKKGAKLGAAAFAAAGTAVVAFSKQAVDSYGEYEQLVGGVQKLYGNAGQSLEEYAQKMGKTTDEVKGEWQKLEDAQNAVLQNAQNAFLTSGKSVNEYMETATGFSAALIKSLGGDTQEAARITDIAMQAMSDNVNTFGTDAEAVQNAFMGLSRQNYMMIDNLKLGYAGTAQGMLELVNDSGVLGKKLKDTSDLANVGFDQMIMAIQKVQEQQGIAGTTSREALRTIEGSANATKKAWENVITAIGRGEGLGDALKGLSTALFGNGEEGTGFLKNVIPRIQTTMESIGEFIVEAAPIIGEQLPKLVSALFPSLFETATSLLTSLADSIPTIVEELFPVLYDTVANVFSTVYEYMMENMHFILEGGANMLFSLAQGVRENLPAIIDTALNVITEFTSWIFANLPQIISAGIELILALIDGITRSIPSVIGAIEDLVEQAWNAITSFDWIGTGKAIIDGIVSGLKNAGGAILDALKDIVGNAWKGIKNFLGIASPSKLFRKTIGKFIPPGIAEGIEDEADTVYDAMEDLAVGTADAYDPMFDDVFSEKVDTKKDSTENQLLNEIRALKDAIMGMHVVLDTGATVGGLAYAMDTELGTISGYKQRGN